MMAWARRASSKSGSHRPPVSYGVHEGPVGDVLVERKSSRVTP